jgi:hypothetical protein
MLLGQSHRHCLAVNHQRSMMRVLWSEGMSGAANPSKTPAQYGNTVLP